MKDTVETIRRSSHRFFSGTLLSRVTGMFRDVSMAYAFGTQPSIAAFMVAFRFAHLLRRLFGEGALQSAFIPEFESLRHQNESRAFHFFRDLMRTLTLFLLIVIGMSCTLLRAVLFWGDLSPGNEEIVTLTLLMLPSLLFICLFGLNSSFLQCEKKYFISSAAPVAFNIIWIVTVFLLKEMPVKGAMPWLSCGVVVACLCQWLLTVPQTWKDLKRHLSFSFSLSPGTFSSLFSLPPDMRRLSKPLTLGILGVAASQINNAIDSVFARFAESEGPAFLWYAIRIQQLPLALFGIAIAGALLPPLSRAIKAGQYQDYHLFLHDALRRTWIFMLPLTAALFVMGDLSVILLYGRGDFDLPAAVQTTYCLWAYGIGLIPSALVLILAPASYAQNNYMLPAIASTITMVLNLIFNTICIVFFEWGAASVALATSVSAWVNFFFLGWNLSKMGISLFSNHFIIQVLPLTLSLFLATSGIYIFRLFIEQLPFFSLNYLSFPSYIQLSILIFMAVAFYGLIFLFNKIFQKSFIYEF